MRETASIALRPTFARRAGPRTQCEPLRPPRSRPPASDAVFGHGIRRIARDGSLQQPCLAVLQGPSERCAAWLTGSAGGANNRRRREGDRGQNAEPASSARTIPGPSAMAVNTDVGDAFCRAELLCLRNRRSRAATSLVRGATMLRRAVESEGDKRLPKGCCYRGGCGTAAWRANTSLLRRMMIQCGHFCWSI